MKISKAQQTGKYNQAGCISYPFTNYPGNVSDHTEGDKNVSQNATFNTWVRVLSSPVQKRIISDTKSICQESKYASICLHGNPCPCLVKCTFSPGEGTWQKLKASFPERQACIFTEVCTRRIQRTKGQKQYSSYNFHWDSPSCSSNQESPDTIVFNKVMGKQGCQHFRITTKATPTTQRLQQQLGECKVCRSQLFCSD